MSLTKVRFLCLNKLVIFSFLTEVWAWLDFKHYCIVWKLLNFTLSNSKKIDKFNLFLSYDFRKLAEKNFWWWVGEVPSSSTQSATHYIVSLENFCFFGCQVRTFRSCKNSCNLTRSNDVYQMFHLVKWKVPHKWVFRLLWLLVASPAN